MSSRPAVLDDTSHSSAMDLSMIIDEADRRRNVSGRGRKSSLVAWETTLEDVLEDEYEEDEEEEEEEEESAMEGTVLEAGGEEDDTTMEVKLLIVLLVGLSEKFCCSFKNRDVVCLWGRRTERRRCGWFWRLRSEKKSAPSSWSFSTRWRKTTGNRSDVS